MQSKQSRFLTVKQAASLLGLAEVTLRVWLAKRKLEYIKMGRAVRIPVTEITRLVDEGTIPALSNGGR
jgi:excisionase family DNA binding protein